MTGSALRTKDDELRDLAEGRPVLVDATRGAPTGVRLSRLLGTGGMATVFLAELDPRERSGDLHPETPARLAIKVMQLSTERELTRLNISPLGFFARETVALCRVMERKPPSEFVVACYGSGLVDVHTAADSRPRRVPWLAIEHVDGGTSGVTLTDRIARSGEGVDPVRALRLITGILAGAQVLHEEGVIHRDLKPDNVLVAGPIDDETPKLADCGIARVAGMQTTVQAATPAYCGPEQMLHVLGKQNALVGTWTDVHAAAAVIWCVLAGEQWCRGDTDLEWHLGRRRSLRTAARVHRGFASHASLLAKLDEVLARGAAQKLPAAVWNFASTLAARDPAMVRGGESLQSRVAHERFPGMFLGETRYATIGDLSLALVPVLEDAVARWRSQAASERGAITAFRPTQMVTIDKVQAAEHLCAVREQSPSSVAGIAPSGAREDVAPGNVVFQPDGKVLARVGGRLVYFVQDVPHRVRVAPEHQPLVDATRWVVRGPRAGFALVGSSHVLLVRGGAIHAMHLPPTTSRITAAVGDGRVFGVATDATEESGGPELWLSDDGERWNGPETLPLGGVPAAIAYGPYGYVVVGAAGKRGRALFLGLDGQVVVFTKEVQQRGPLTTALCGAENVAWAAGDGFVVRCERGVATPEPLELPGTPAALGLDPSGIPWLVTRNAVLRRHVDAGQASWRAYYARPADRAPLVAIGFTPEGARVLDGTAGSVHLRPHDADRWSAVSATAFAVG